MMDMMLLADSDNVKESLLINDNLTNFFTILEIQYLLGYSILQGSNFELQENQDNATLTRRLPQTSRQFSDKLQDLEQSETLENIVKTTSTNNDDELLKRVTMITEEHLSNLVPVIADFISFVSNKVK